MLPGLEAHKLINISLGKIAAARAGRTGASLHKSLLVASVLHKARFVYLEEAQYHHTIYCPQTQEPESIINENERAPTPVPEVTVTPVLVNTEETSEQSVLSDEHETLCSSEDDKENSYPLHQDNRLDEDDERIPLSENNCRKRRRVSDQETEAAVSSILPKKLKSDCEENSSFVCSVEEPDLASTCGDYEDEEDNMEVDHITSLVSIISFSHQQHHQDYCSTQAHQVGDTIGGLPVVALTA